MEVFYENRLKRIRKTYQTHTQRAGSYARNVSRESWCQPALYL